jgi:ATP-dependent Clp protease ATP-binding subunit ClpB
MIQEQLQFINKDNRDQILGELRIRLIDLLRDTIRPEFLNRIDEIILFKPLTEEEIRKIVDLQLNYLIERIERNNIKLTADNDSKDWLGKLGYDIHYGARPLKRIIQKYVTNPLSEKILSGEFLPGDSVLLTLNKQGLITFEKKD